MAALLLIISVLSIFLIPALPHSVGNFSHQHQQQELLLRFKATVSRNGTSLPDWTPRHSFCNWSGVICHSSSHSVRAIDLTQMGLDGTISPVLGNLSSLRYLVLAGNYLTGTIPSQLGQLRNLWMLRLDNNQLQGTVPPGLSACRSLYYLALSYNQLHGSIPPELSLLKSLKYLYIGANSLTGMIPSSFKNLSTLVLMNLAENNLSGTIPPELGMLTNLQTLYLFENNLRGTIPGSLTNLSNLNDLSLSDNQIIGQIPWDIGTKLSNLEYLGLWGNQLSGNIPNSLGNCSHLEVLILSINRLSGTVPKELGMLNLLTQLDLYSNQLVSDSSKTLAFLTALTNCSHLQEIVVSYNNFKGILPPSIGQLSSNLNYLGLQFNMINGSIPQQIVNLTSLTFLALYDNLFSGNIPSGIKRLQKLERLFLGGNKLEGSIPSDIGQMQHLGLLNLSHNQLSGKIPDSLCNSQQLRRLLLYHNKLSGKIPVSMQGCQKLELLDLSHNKLEGRIPGEVIARLKNLQFYLNLSGNSLKGSLPQEMSKIVMAQAIDISGNQLTGLIPDSIGDCSALERPNLSHNAFVGPIPHSLSKLKNLEEIDLSFNNLSGQIPPGGLFRNRSVVVLFMGNPGVCGPKNYSLLPCPIPTHETHSLLKKVVLLVAGIIAFLLICFGLVMLWRHKLSKRLVRPSNLIFRRLGYPKFSYQDLVISTSGFDESNLLGVGNFGSVYKGILRDGRIIAMKILNFTNEEALKSFKRECKLLGRIRHRNLIRIISAFSYPDLKGLVLQFACNGSLEKHLHPDRDDEHFCKLGLSECLSIATDVAHGMEYLHHDCPLQIVHCDLKPSNVLLDADMTALVTDFGISRLTSTNSVDSLSTTTFALKGSIGYIAPEYGLGGSVSTKGDVYSYGILILEMVTRKRPNDDMFVGDLNLQKWVRLAFPDRLTDIIDSELLNEVNENMEDDRCLLSFIHIGLLCTAESPSERPSIRDVAKTLGSLKPSSMGGAASSMLTATISELLKTNPTGTLAPDSQSSTF
ncbi:probable LRR receptor-like serine/threonine-protein kinase At3g47570 [Cryptomeria japonica]|uniref:probable LRR receptor-like serine/threonine-protein kinase At3g47570 n=1 Tax=Cryptomeria japonica TaxID=3369 RepID=UPI0027DAA979|nr:probable LRR receptor-like serine/threonine-protein kinase At3g47570 [Cryptomeria japonica]